MRQTAGSWPRRPRPAPSRTALTGRALAGGHAMHCSGSPIRSTTDMPTDLLIYANSQVALPNTTAQAAVCESNGMLWALLRQYARPYRPLLAVVAALQVISTLASLYLPTVNAAIIDDGVAKGDTRTIVELGGVMLGVTALQVVCAVGAVYFGSRAGMGVRPRSALGDLRPRHRLLGGGDGAVRRAVAADPHHQRRPADPAAGPADLHHADHRADHVRSAASSWRSIRTPACRGCCWSACRCWRWPTTGSCRTCCRSSGGMQRLIDGINRVMREQLSGIRVIRAFAREPFERNRFGEANQALSDTALAAGRVAGADAAGHHAGDQHLQRRADLVRRHADRRRPDAGRVADRVPVVLHADPDGGADGDVHAGAAAARLGVRRADHRGAVHRRRRSPARETRRGPIPSRRDPAWTARRSAIPARTALCCRMFR